MTNQNKFLDQFFTQDDVVDQCLSVVKDLVTNKNLGLKESILFVEPSAGDGAFSKKMVGLGWSTKAYDIDPKATGIRRRDFLTLGLPRTKKDTSVVLIGNPPFGKRATTAIKFFNIAAKKADVIAFIVPVQFRKWGVQSKLDNRFALISDTLLREDAFRVGNKPYSVRCCFQVWTNRTMFTEDFRLKNAPPIQHPDFEMYQYNNTEQALKVFDYPFDFAVPRQGWADYTRREHNPTHCEKTTQWVLFRAKNKSTLSKLYNLDFEKLAKRNTTTPGFGKADVVSFYKETYNAK